jgi:hypothetical protein
MISVSKAIAFSFSLARKRGKEWYIKTNHYRCLVFVTASTPQMRACSKGVKKKRIKTTNIIDTVSSKVQNKFTNERKRGRGITHIVFISRPARTPAQARLLPSRVRGCEARASATLFDLRKGVVVFAAGGDRGAWGDRSSSANRFLDFGSATGRGDGASQSGHAHRAWKISSSLTLSGVSDVALAENGGTRVSISVCAVVSSVDNEGWRSTMDRNGGPSC